MAPSDTESDLDFLHSYCASRFALSTTCRADWRPPSELLDAVALTTRGQEIHEAIGVRDGEAADAAWAILLAFGDDQPFLDLTASDTAAILRLVSDELVTNRLLVPWDFGRLLSDKIATVYGGARDVLDNSETLELLAQTPQGVFQLATLVSGPLGLLQSSQGRRLPPALGVGAVPCADPGCAGLHHVRLSPGDTIARGYLEQISHISHTGGDWSSLLRRLVTPFDDHVDDENAAELPIALANALSRSELAAVVTSLLTKQGSPLRRLSQLNPALEALFQQSADGIVDGLDAAALLQLALLCTDAELVFHLETLIDAAVINVPPTEVRSAVFELIRLDTGTFHPQCQISLHGVRFMPDRAVATLRLRRLVNQVYVEPRDKRELEWKLRLLGNGSAALDEHLSEDDPRELITSLILGTREFAEAAASHFELGRFPLPGDDATFGIEQLRDRILWKLGFPINTFPSTLRTFWTRLERLRQAAAEEQDPYDEVGQERLRSAAVNAFVSLEEVLDLSLSFATWALLNDHYGERRLERFKFSLAAARSFMSATLSGADTGADEPLVLRADGRNTLYPLTVGFSVLAKLCRAHLQDDGEQHRRDDMPFWFGRTQLMSFPFVHVLPVLDIAPEGREALIKRLESVEPEFATARVLDVRNRLEHKREPFPRRTEVDHAVQCIRDLGAELEEAGIIPSVFQLHGRSSDQFGRSRTTFVDYRDRTAIVRSPSPLQMSGLPKLDQPQLFLRDCNWADATEPIRFRYSEASEFDRMWQGFPIQPKRQ
jgi:hypothetical protein